MRFLTDEHIPNAVVRQLQRKYPQAVDVVRAFDAGLTGASDAELLAWAAEHGRIIITANGRKAPAFRRGDISPLPRMGQFSLSLPA
jgi:hypothetical protein